MEYKNPCVTADVILENDLGQVLLIKRLKEPYKDCWAFPGGHMDYGIETVENAAVRELLEETTLVGRISDLKLVGVYSDPSRDPRGHYVTCAYSLTKYEGVPKACDDAKECQWFSLDNLPEMAFDHQKIMEDYIKWKKE